LNGFSFEVRAVTVAEEPRVSFGDCAALAFQGWLCFHVALPFIFCALSNCICR
jgi:hypothetical protein